MAGNGVEHRAYFSENDSGTWDGGCFICGVAFYGETDRGRADAWCNGHNSAVARIADRPVPLWFPPVGPGDAITLPRLREAIDEAMAYLDQEGFPTTGELAEIVQPAAFPPLLFVWTPPTEEGWKRIRLGAILAERNGAFIPEPDAATYGIRRP
jgi:hypothetical protein